MLSVTVDSTGFVHRIHETKSDNERILPIRQVNINWLHGGPLMAEAV